MFHTPISKKGNLSIAKHHRGITLTSIAAKIYNSMLLNRITPAIYNVLRKNQNGFRVNMSINGQILTILQILEGIELTNITAIGYYIVISYYYV